MCEQTANTSLASPVDELRLINHIHPPVGPWKADDVPSSVDGDASTANAVPSPGEAKSKPLPQGRCLMRHALVREGTSQVIGMRSRFVLAPLAAAVCLLGGHVHAQSPSSPAASRPRTIRFHGLVEPVRSFTVSAPR